MIFKFSVCFFVCLKWRKKERKKERNNKRKKGKKKEKRKKDNQNLWLDDDDNVVWKQNPFHLYFEPHK